MRFHDHRDDWCSIQYGANEVAFETGAADVLVTTGAATLLEKGVRRGTSPTVFEFVRVDAIREERKQADKVVRLQAAHRGNAGRKVVDSQLRSAQMVQARVRGKTTRRMVEEQRVTGQLPAQQAGRVEVPGGSAPAAKPVRGLCQRLKGKSGRFRGSLSGKRVDFSARTVISPDPNLRVDQVGVPREVAMIMTYPERVTAQNLEKLQRCVVNGAKEWPGANYVEIASGDPGAAEAKLGGFKKSLLYGDRSKISADLRVGDVVERHMEDGDIVLFNRQPSLHKLSIMSHKAKVMPWRTFRFNECVCAPYNADFDGDEMNMHLPQTEEARAEAYSLMNVPRNICTPRNGEPLVAATQDFVTASFVMTQRDVFLTRDMFCAMAAYVGDALERVDVPPPAILKPCALWTGKQLYGVVVRPRLPRRKGAELGAASAEFTPEWPCVSFECPERNYTGGDVETMCPMDGFVLFRRSQLLAGNVAKKTIGPAVWQAGSARQLSHTRMSVMRVFGSSQGCIHG